MPLYLFLYSFSGSLLAIQTKDCCVDGSPGAALETDYN